MSYSGEQLRLIAAHYDALKKHDAVLQELAKAKNYVIKGTSLLPLKAELERIANDCPGLIPEVDFQRLQGGPANYYDLPAVRTHVGSCLAYLKAALSETDAPEPVTETLDFSFVKSVALRTILERDYADAQRGYLTGCWKSAIILAGGGIEALLLDALQRRESEAKAAVSAPKKALPQWDLADLIKVAAELGVIQPIANTLADVVRKYRNLVHPGLEIREGLRPDKLEAQSGLNVFRIVQRDLSKP